MATGLNLITRVAVDSALAEFATSGRDRFLDKYGFGRALEYLVKDPLTGGWADSKAIVGAAYGYRFPDRGPLRSSDFSGGEVQVVRLLRELGFEIASRSDIEGEEAGRASWSRAEVELLVADHLQMLALELAGQVYNKAQRRRALLPLLNARSEASIEFKHRNVSAVLLAFGYPTIKGYLPAANVQSILTDIVEQQLGRQTQLDDLARSYIELPAVPAEVVDFEGLRVDRPPAKVKKAEEPGVRRFTAVKRDYLEREARNSSLGKAGELFVLRYEQWRLTGAGCGQLAEKVRHVSVEDGDGLGHDIASFERDGSTRYIEVKTTAFRELTPFYVTATELDFARVEGNRFALYRLFDFRRTPRFFELAGPVENHCSLDPRSFRATLN